MDLYREIILGILEKDDIPVVFSDSGMNINEIIKADSYNTLQKIKTVIENDSLDSDECFLKIKEIIKILENIGNN